MKTRIVFMFSGQGSQYEGMGRQLYDRNRVFRLCMDEFSEAAAPFLGVHLAHEMYCSGNAGSDALVRTRYTNPVLFMFNYAVAETLQSCGVVPDLLLGYSLGEFTAAAFSGTVDRFELFLSLIRASFALEKHAPAGGMLAVLDSRQLWERNPEWFRGSSLASVNCSRSFVVSGPTPVLDQVQDRLRSGGVLFQRLPVNQAFHSHWIDGARSSVCREIGGLALRKHGRFPVYSCAAPGTRHDGTETVKFWDAMREPVLFEPAVQTVDESGPKLYIDVGPSGTLAAFVKYSVGASSRSQALPVVDRFGRNEIGLQNAVTKAAAWQSL